MPTDPTICPDCGSPAPKAGQSFCDSCGAFLRWDRPTAPSSTQEPERTPAAADPTPPAPAAGPVSSAGRPAEAATGTPAQAPATPPAPATGDGGARQAAAAQQNPDAAPTAPLPPAAPHQGDAGRPQPGPTGQANRSGKDGQGTPAAPNPPTGDQGVSETGIRALLVPVPGASPTPPPEAPGSVLPGRPEPARPRVRTPHTDQPVDGAPCRSCHTLNTPGRHFCRSCAIPLVETTAETAEGPYAGERPRLNRTRGRWIARAIVAAVIVAVVVGGIFGGPPAARAIQDHFAKRIPVPAATWKASHAGPGHAAKLAFDTYSNTWWGTGYSGNSNGQYLQAGFGQPTDLLNVLITPGASPRTPQATDPARPREFDLIVTDSAGKQYVSHPRLNDGGPQKIDVAVRNAVSVRLVLRSAYGTTDEKQVAISELEFFGHSAR
ncbi:NADase-type glycan-binding domain-containing protein [Streptomyces sp. NPDC058773]|uniref:NADase-type glycan-binding domain-containing protein n=1 Tax=Streptomyces sp. NPDC058773 TaxID=3346632 RepID=UPI0036B3DC52